MQAVNASGRSVWAYLYDQVVGTVPSAVRSFVAVRAASLTALDLSWLAPLNMGNPALSGYTIEYQEVGATAWTDGPTTGAAAITQTITGLTTGRIYNVRIRPDNAVGGGPWSTVSGVSLAAVPGRPTSPSV